MSGPATFTRIRRAEDRKVRGLGRWPFTPVDRLLVGVDSHVAAEVCGVTRETLLRWRRCGLNEQQADTLATRLGVHPTALWPDLYAACVAVAAS